jgi:hypothetical protein
VNAQGKRRRVESVVEEGGSSSAVDKNEEVVQDASIIIETLSGRVKDLSQQLILIEAKQQVADAEVEVRVAKKILEMQKSVADEVRVPEGGGDEEERLAAMAADYNSKLAFKEAERNSKLAEENLTLSRRRNYLEKDYGSKNKFVEDMLQMNKDLSARMEKRSAGMSAEVKKRVCKIRADYEKRLSDALKPKTSVEAQLDEFKKQLVDERSECSSLRHELEMVKQKLDKMGVGDDNESEEEEESESSEEEEQYVVKEDRMTEIAHLKLLFTNAARMRDRACTAREEMRLSFEALEKDTEEKQTEAKREIDRLTREVR